MMETRLRTEIRAVVSGEVKDAVRVYATLNGLSLEGVVEEALRAYAPISSYIETLSKLKTAKNSSKSRT